MGSKRKRTPKGGTENGSNGAKRSKSNSSKPSKGYFTKSLFVEQPVDDERRREGTLYDSLGSEDEAVRLEAAECIISSLFGDGHVSEAVLERHLQKRLFRGLASGRNASRLGFSLVITELLSQLFGPDGLAASKYPDLSFEKVLGFLTENSQAIGNVPGQEERDHFFGQLFGIECFVKAKILFLDIKRWRKVLELLISTGNRKVWLRSQCGWVIVQAMDMMDRNEVEFTLNKVAEDGLAKTPEGVAFWIAGLKRYPGLKIQPWDNPLSKKSLGDLTLVLKESFRENDQVNKDKKSNQNKQANWTAQLHFVWDAILSTYTQGHVSGAEEFGRFWSRVVDEGLFSKQATDGQKFKGFMIFQTFLEGLANQREKVACLFTKHLMTCLVNQAAKEDRYVHRAAIKALKAIEACVVNRPALVPVVLENILGSKGAYNFDQRTNTKTVEKILRHLDQENEEESLSIISQPIKSIQELDQQNAQSLLRQHVDYLSKFLSSIASLDEDSEDSARVSTFALKEICRLAYSAADHVPASALTDSIKHLCRTRLEGFLAQLSKRKENFKVFCDTIFVILGSFETGNETINAYVQAAKKRMQALLEKQTQAQGQKDLNHGLAMLHAVALFQLCNEDPDAVEVMLDLEVLAEKLEGGMAGEGSSELLVEILLANIARPSSLMRQVSHHVFDIFTSQISSDGLELITSPLLSSENTKGQQEIFNIDDPNDVDADDSKEGESEPDSDDDSDDSDDEVDVDDMSDVEIDGDVQFLGINGDDANSIDEEADVANDGEGSDEDTDDEESQPENQDDNNIDAAIGTILNSHTLDKDQEAVSSDSDEDMSDSEMLQLDEKLAEVFRNRADARPDTRRDKKDARQTVVNFKHRLLDLLDIYVKNEAVNPLAFAVLTPLLRLVRTTSTKALASRGCEIILTYQKTLKKARSSETSPAVLPREEFLAHLAEVHVEAGKDNAHAFAKAASAASLIIASSMFVVDSEFIRDVASVYAETQSEWVLGSVNMQTSFFTDWNNWCQGQAALARQARR